MTGVMASIASYRIEIAALSEADGGGFIAFAPELPGCMSDGPTQEQAIENLRDAIAQWIDAARTIGRPVPDPAFY